MYVFCSEEYSSLAHNCQRQDKEIDSIWLSKKDRRKEHPANEMCKNKMAQARCLPSAPQSYRDRHVVSQHGCRRSKSGATRPRQPVVGGSDVLSRNGGQRTASGESPLVLASVRQLVPTSAMTTPEGIHIRWQVANCLTVHVNKVEQVALRESLCRQPLSTAFPSAGRRTRSAPPTSARMLRCLCPVGSHSGTRTGLFAAALHNRDVLLLDLPLEPAQQQVDGGAVLGGDEVSQVRLPLSGVFGQLGVRDEHVLVEEGAGGGLPVVTLWSNPPAHPTLAPAPSSRPAPPCCAASCSDDCERRRLWALSDCGL